MLSINNRLTKERDFKLLLKRGFWVKGENISLKILPLSQNRKYFPKKEDVDNFEKQLKIAFSVGVKISKSAVVRNKVKRQLREAVRLLIKENGIKSGYYFLFVPQPSIVNKNFAEISEEIKLLFSNNNFLLK